MENHFNAILILDCASDKYIYIYLRKLVPCYYNHHGDCLLGYRLCYSVAAYLVELCPKVIYGRAQVRDGVLLCSGEEWGTVVLR